MESDMKIKMILLVLTLTGSLSWAGDVFTGEHLNRPFTVHGRLRNYNGSATMRIWIVGSKRVLYVGAESPASEKINKLFREGSHWFTHDIYADFTVEPLEPDIKGHMRPVRILAVDKMVIIPKEKIVPKETAP
jgi:hypothetical protein